MELTRLSVPFQALPVAVELVQEVRRQLDTVFDQPSLLDEGEDGEE